MMLLPTFEGTARYLSLQVGSTQFRDHASAATSSLVTISQYPWIVFTHSCSPDGAISTQVNTLNKCLSNFGSFKVFGLSTKYTNSLIDSTLRGNGLYRRSAATCIILLFDLDNRLRQLF